ncbi:hypothetical protein [Hymenobacter convexus]|uniref:hypothetical protein n=1 Tax=Hymenobacter sp. CA1UV-4 TaxID=3063782 RepID=UPI002714498A|nr:hypothetical protein [Hymenobacter sp. CA1UV-4]MDO7852552.1 hypothetical protein [Hymenobacter sp. CA1UV-4]
MAASLPDFEYDIFISYRHNDNQFDGWVTEFVTHLKDELRATVKGELRIYFDGDRTDGLGETHQVDASLGHRLRSLILMPLLSLTYCDTERFSWQHEFLPFRQLASTDALGLNLPLASGNVGSRILPLRIHNLDADDVRLLEHTMGGPLRSIDFVYQELGVNRPLRPKDDELPRPPGGLLYRNQINKVANAVKELVLAARQATAAPTSPLPVAPVVAAGAGAVPAGIALPPLAAAPPAGPVVFLAWTSKELTARREELALVCAKAGLRVVPGFDCPPDEDEYRARTREALAEADCAIHLLGNEFGRRFEDDEDCSFPMFAYREARARATDRSLFRQVVWYSPDDTQPVRPAQQAFVDAIYNELTKQCTLTTVGSAMQVVENVRAALTRATPPPAAVEKENDIFFVYNEQDSEEANAITDRLSEEFPLDTLAIEPDSEELYKNLAVQAIPKSRLAVVYFKYSADWALPFVKQVWRLVGGAQSTTSILFVGEDDPAQNRMRGFKAPRVISSIRPHLDVSEEVRRVLGMQP